MKYISLFSGIEAATVAWEPLGWEPVAFAEIEPFPSAVLAARWPDVPNLGDVTKVDWSQYRGECDLVIGGSPCQSFSIAGLRKGLADPRGNLMLEYLRACYEIDPEWIVWENVPGVLSADGRRAFQTFLEAVVELWPRGGVCWRVLDAQFFGVAQRRRRVFAVINTRDWRRSLAVLQEPGGMFGDSTSSRDKREELAGTVGYRAPRHLRGNSEARPSEHGCVSGHCAEFRYQQGGTAGSIGYQEELSPTLDTIRQPSVIAFAQNTRDEVRFQGDGDMCRALSAQPGMKQTTYVVQPKPICLADDTAKAACDVDLCGSLKVGGGIPAVCSRVTGTTSSGPCVRGTTRARATRTLGKES